MALSASLAIAALGGSACAFDLVRDGAPRSVIVVAPDAAPEIRQAAAELQLHVRLASDAELSIIGPDQAASVDPAWALLLVGPSTLTKTAGVPHEDLPPEAYRVRTVGRHMVFLGHDLPIPRTASTQPDHSAATLWAVGWFLDHHLGARWLWPGPVGTYVPRRATIAMPDVDLTQQPAMDHRILRMPTRRNPVPGLELLMTAAQHRQFVDELWRWSDHHQMGSRSTLQFGHAFGKWWDQYGKDHPDFFAVPPAGAPAQPFPTAARVKLCLTNPAVDDMVIREWQEAGAPDSWNICPNDGSGFCTCDRCRAADVPANQDPMTIWRAQGKLTARYVNFWNRILPRMRAINPKVQLASYAYSCYRDPPPAGLKVQPGITLQWVDSFVAFDSWLQWRQAGAEQLRLRPNWWHTGAVAPYLMLHKTGRFFEFARQHAMVGFDFDSIMGHWGTYGPNYYLIARMSVRPEMSVAQVMDEYASAFEEAAPAIREYLNYWETFADKAAYSVSAGGNTVLDPNGPYEMLARQHKFSNSALVGSWEAIPYFYTDQVIGAGQAILDRAMASLPTDRTAARDRVQFLVDGLRHLRLTRDVLALGYDRTRPAGATPDQFQKLATELQALRRELTPRHVVWGETLNQEEHRRGIPTAPGRAKWTQTDGM